MEMWKSYSYDWPITEQQINSLQMPLAIVYTPKSDLTELVTKYNLERSRGFILYSWSPRPFNVIHNLQRIMLPQWQPDCVAHSGLTSVDESTLPYNCDYRTDFLQRYASMEMAPGGTELWPMCVWPI